MSGDYMNYWPWWPEDLAAEVAPPGGGIPELPRPRGGSFLPDPGGSRSPGYSCVHCGALCARRHPRSLLIHCWNKSIFCDWRRLDFRRARLAA